MPVNEKRPLEYRHVSFRAMAKHIVLESGVRLAVDGLERHFTDRSSSGSSSSTKAGTAARADGYESREPRRPPPPERREWRAPPRSSSSRAGVDNLGRCEPSEPSARARAYDREPRAREGAEARAEAEHATAKARRHEAVQRLSAALYQHNVDIVGGMGADPAKYGLTAKDTDAIAALIVDSDARMSHEAKATDAVVVVKASGAMKRTVEWNPQGFITVHQKIVLTTEGLFERRKGLATITRDAQGELHVDFGVKRTIYRDYKSPEHRGQAEAAAQHTLAAHRAMRRWPGYAVRELENKYTFIQPLEPRTLDAVLRGPGVDGRAQRSAMLSLSRALQRLHEDHFIHPDINASRIFARDTPAGLQLVLADFMDILDRDEGPVTSWKLTADLAGPDLAARLLEAGGFAEDATPPRRMTHDAILQLGCLFFEMRNPGASAMPAATVEGVEARVRERAAVDRQRMLAAGIVVGAHPQSIDGLIESMIDPDPRKRPLAREVVAALQAMPDAAFTAPSARMRHASYQG